MQRFRATHSWPDHKEGQYVLYAEAQAEIDALRDQLEASQAAQDEMWTRKGYLEAQLAELQAKLGQR